MHCFVAGKHVKGIAEEASKVPGVDRVVTVENAAYEKVRGNLVFTLVEILLCLGDKGKSFLKYENEKNRRGVMQQASRV